MALRPMALLVTLATCTTMKTVAMAAESCDDDYCYPGQRCWPTMQEELDFVKMLDGVVYTASDPHYANMSIMMNTAVTRYPYAIIMVASVHDVIRTVKFANLHNIKLSIRSSGHDFIGRSTGDGTLQINVYNMNDLKFELNSTRNEAGELTAQAGNNWYRVYTEANKHERVVVGGSCKTVSISGYTMGGGHSAIGRKFGLGVDNLLEVEMVTANGSLVYADEYSTRFVDPDTGDIISTSDNTDIFWALRGGGGGTFGVVTAFTFKLHYDSKMVMLKCYAPMKDENGTDVGIAFAEAFNEVLRTTLAPEWSGYENFKRTDEPDDGSAGGIYLNLNHYGEWGSDSFNTILPFLSKMEPYCNYYRNVSSYLEYYTINANHSGYQAHALYLLNTFLQRDSFTDSFYEFMTDFISGNQTVDMTPGCTGFLIGGAMQNVSANATAISPSFRNGVIVLTCDIVPGDTMDYDVSSWTAEGERLSQMLMQYGDGMYTNQPSAYLPNWKAEFWGGHYDRLLAIKQDWDPDNVFSCLHCVGTD